MSSKKGEENIIKINIRKIIPDENKNSLIKSNEGKYEANSLVYKKIINIKYLYFLCLYF